MYETEDMVIVETIADTLVSYVAVAAVFTLSMSCCTGIGLKPILDSFKNIQVILNIMLIDLFSVAICEVFFAKLLQIANIEVIDPSSWFIKYLPVI